MQPPFNRNFVPTSKTGADPRQPEFYSGTNTFSTNVGNPALVPKPSMGIDPMTTIANNYNDLMLGCNSVNDQRTIGSKLYGTGQSLFSNGVNATPINPNNARLWNFLKEDRLGLSMKT